MEKAAELKINRIKSANRGSLSLLGDSVSMALATVPKLQQTAKNRVEFRRMEDSMSKLGAYCRVNGFDPSRSFQHVANIDSEVWALIVSMFAKEDDDGNLLDDGLLYKYDESKGCVSLNKDFFFALIDYLESCGIPVDMRGRIKLN
jgi:hypothetical protein